MTVRFFFSSLIAATLLALTALQAQAQDTLERLKETGVVNLGVRESSGLGFALGKGDYVGFHTEMAKRIVDDIATKIGRPLTINYQPLTSENRIPLLQNGTIDFECGSTTNNRARAKQADFAYTTYVEEVRIATKKGSGIKRIEDLDGKTVATTTGTTSVITLRRNQRAHNLKINEINGKDHADSFLLLESGRADAFIMDGSILASNISKSKNPQDYVVLDDILSVEPIACMLRLNDLKLKQAINDSIVRQIRDGSLEKLYTRWFLEPVPPTNTIVGLPLSKTTKEAWEHPNSKPMEDYPENHL